MCCLFPLPTTSYSIRPQYLIFFSFQWFPKLFTDDYLANYMTRVEATKVKVYNSCYHDNALEVFLKAVKDGRAIVTRGWTKVVRAYVSRPICDPILKELEGPTKDRSTY